MKRLLIAFLLAASFAMSGTALVVSLRPAPVAPVVAAPAPLASDSLIVVRTVTADGVEVAPPVTMPLWKYVEVERGGKDEALRLAIESDLHAHDATFHLTHEEIDGRRWGQ